MKFVKLLQTTLVASCVVFGAVSTVQASKLSQEEIVDRFFKEWEDPNYQKGIKAFHDKKDYKTAVKYFTKAAKKGNSRAEERLGFIYSYGVEGIKANHKKALDFLESSCNKGYNRACEEIRFMFLGCAAGMVDCTVLDSPKYTDVILKECSSGGFTEVACNNLKKKLTILK